MKLNDLLQQSFAILGFGREGRALAWALKLRQPQIRLHIFTETYPKLREPLHEGHDQLYVGPLDEADFSSYKVLVKSPGISLYHAAIVKARTAGSVVTSTTNLWFAERPDARCLCITGTKGKSTTAALITHILRYADKSVELAGNIGVPVIERLDSHPEWWVMELSSYQLADLEARPEVGLLLSLYPEHLDWHQGESHYRSDKLRLLSQAHMAWAPADMQVNLQQELGRELTPFNVHSGLHATQQGIVEGSELLLAAGEIPLRGEHNRINICAAWALARYAGVEDAVIAAAVREFHPLPHRLMEVGEVAGIRYVNDSISTTPHATVAALRAYGSVPVTVIIGGHDRGLDWSPFLTHVRDYPPYAVITLPQNGKQIADALTEQQCIPPGGIHCAHNLDEAVAIAKRITGQGGLVLLSPGAPSYGSFRDFEERGSRFIQLIQVNPVAH